MGKKNARTGIAVEVGTEEVPRIPAWFGEAMPFGKYWLDSGLVGYLEEEVRVERGRMGQYEVMDFVLVLISYAISGERMLPSAPAKRVRGLLQSNHSDQGSVDESMGAELLSVRIKSESIFRVHSNECGRSITQLV